MLSSILELFGRFDNQAAVPDEVKETSSCLMPEGLLPIQYYSARMASPYDRLLLAVLEDAIRCFQRNWNARTRPRKILFQEARAWLFDFDASAFMSCPAVCESLGIDPSLLRRRLHEWHRRIRCEGDNWRE